jgi:hypothetical protein
MGSARSTFAACLGLLLVLSSVSAWPGVSTRRLFVQSAAITTAIAIASPAQAASTSALLEDLRVSKERMQAIPSLLEEKEWDKVRSILKLPPVNKLWNLGDVSTPTIFSNSFVIQKISVVLTISHDFMMFDCAVSKHCLAARERNWQRRFV